MYVWSLRSNLLERERREQGKDTHRSVFPVKSIEEPSARTSPIAVNDPSMELAEATPIPPPVENRNHVPSEVRWMRAGSCVLHAPEHTPGFE